MRRIILAAGVALAGTAHAQTVPAIDASAQARASVTAATTPGAVVQQTGSTQNPAVAVPRTMPPAIPDTSPDKALNAKQAVGVAMARQWIQRFQKPRLDQNGVVHFIYGRGQASIVCAVDHVCDIALQPGEVVSPPILVGDQSAWMVRRAVSGSGSSRTEHVMVKPTDAGLSTNVVVQTNRRTYSIDVVSRRRDYMPLVAFDYPDEDDSGMGGTTIAAANTLPPGSFTATCDQEPTIRPSEFEIERSSAPWRPVQVYGVTTPVGIKLCIQFPADIRSRNLPALVALGDDGGWFSSPSMQPVNFRYVRGRFEVDGLLNKLMLVDGVGGDQIAVKIVRKGP